MGALDAMHSKWGTGLCAAFSVGVDEGIARCSIISLAGGQKVMLESEYATDKATGPLSISPSPLLDKSISVLCRASGSGAKSGCIRSWERPPSL